MHGCACQYQLELDLVAHARQVGLDLGRQQTLRRFNGIVVYVTPNPAHILRDHFHLAFDDRFIAFITKQRYNLVGQTEMTVGMSFYRK